MLALMLNYECSLHGLILGHTECLSELTIVGSVCQVGDDLQVSVFLRKLVVFQLSRGLCCVVA